MSASNAVDGAGAQGCCKANASRNEVPGGVCLIPIGRGENDLRFHFRMDGRHAGGITVHSVRGDSFSYGIAVAKDMRRKGAASAALGLLFERMKARGYALAVVRIEAENEASLALHAKLGFVHVAQRDGVVFLQKAL